MAAEILVLLVASAPRVVRGQAAPSAAAPIVEGPALVLIVSEPRSLPDIGPRPQRPAKKTFWVTVTAYSSTVDQTDGDPFTTASGAKVRDGIVAWNGVPFGTTLRLPSHFGDKIFIVQDRLHKRNKRVVDIWMSSREEALEFGKKRAKILVAN